MSTQNVNVGITANTAGLSQLNTAVSGVQQSLNALQSTLASVSGAAQTANTAVAQTGSSMQGMSSGINASSTAMSFLAGVAGGAAAMAIQKLGQVMAQMNPLKFASDMAESARELEKTASAMNMTAERAQALNDVIEDAELPAEAVTSAMRKLNRQLGENEGGLNKMGIATRDANGGLVSQETLFQNSVKALLQYKEGTDRNAASMEIFGRANIDLAKASQITSSALDESEKRMSALNNQFTPERMQNASNFRQGMRDLADVGEGLTNTIGAAVLPIMTKFAEELADIGERVLPFVIEASDALGQAFDLMYTIFAEVADAIGSVISVLWDAFVMLFGGLTDGMNETGNSAESWKDMLATVFSVLKQIVIGFAASFKIAVEAVSMAFEMIYNIIAGAVEVIATRLFAFSEAAQRAMSFDFRGAVAAWNAGTQQIEQVVAKRFNNILASAKNFKSDFDKIAAEATGKIVSAQNGTDKTPGLSLKYGGGGGSRSFAGGVASAKASSGASKEADAQVRAEQDLAKAQADYAMKIFKENMRQEEAELKRSLDQRTITSAEYFSRLGALKQQQIDAEIRYKEAEIATIREAMDKKGLKLSERIKFQGQELRLTGDIRELEMKRAETQRDFAEQARKAAENIDKQKQSMREQIANMSGIGILESKLTAIASKFADLPKELIGSAEARSLQALESMKARLDDFDKQMADKSEMEKAKIESMKAKGTTTEEGGKQRLLKLEREILGAKLNTLRAELAQAKAASDPTRVAMLEKEISLLQLKADTVAEGAAEIAQVNNAIESGFENFFGDIMSGTKSVKDAFKDLSSSIVSEINSIVSKKLARQLMESLFGGEGGAAGGGFNLSGMLGKLFGGGSGGSGGGFNIGSIFSSIGGGVSSMFGSIGSMFSGFLGGFASGGYAMSGQPYLVGENGPELFIPGASGSVMPNESMGGLGGVTVHQTINTPDANSFRRASAQVMTDYQRALVRASRRNG